MNPPPRPAFVPPADFTDHFHLSNVALGERYGVNRATIIKVRKRLGVGFSDYTTKRHKRPVPDDLAQLAESMLFSELLKHYRCGHSVLDRWLRETGITPAKSGVPAWFVSDAPGMTREQVIARSGAAAKTVYKWELATGVRCLRVVRPKAPPKPKPEKFERVQPERTRIIKPRGRQPIDRTQRDMSLAGQAAHHLQKMDSIHRCDAAGQFKLGGSHWKFRGRVYDAAGIIQRAKDAKWQPDAWASLGQAA